MMSVIRLTIEILSFLECLQHSIITINTSKSYSCHLLSFKQQSSFYIRFFLYSILNALNTFSWCYIDLIFFKILVTLDLG